MVRFVPKLLEEFEKCLALVRPFHILQTYTNAQTQILNRCNPQFLFVVRNNWDTLEFGNRI